MRRCSVSALLCLITAAPAWADFAAVGIPATDPGFVAWATGTTDLTRGLQNIANPAGPLASFGTAANALGTPNASDGTPFGSSGVVSLGDGGRITLTFDRPIYNGTGADFAVFENGFAFDPAWGLGVGNFSELAFVEVSSDGTHFYRFASTSLTQTSTQVGTFDPIDPTKINNLAGQFVALEGTPFDLTELAGVSPLLDVNAVTHVRIIDVVGSLDGLYRTFDAQGNPINERWPTDFDSGGFDLDAVGVIHQTPVPPSFLLLGIGSTLTLGAHWLRGRRTVRVS